MSLETLTFTDKTPRTVAANPKARLRAKMLERLDQQIGAAEAAGRGETFIVNRRRWIENKESGEKLLRDVPVRVRPWWWKDETGAVQLTLRHGNKPLEVQNGKTSIAVGDPSKLVEILQVVRAAVVNGELDEALSNARAANPLPKREVKVPRKR